MRKFLRSASLLSSWILQSVEAIRFVRQTKFLFFQLFRRKNAPFKKEEKNPYKSNLNWIPNKKFLKNNFPLKLLTTKRRNLLCQSVFLQFEGKLQKTQERTSIKADVTESLRSGLF